MQELTFSEAEARIWNREVEDLIQKTDQTLKEVSQELINIKSVSTGPFVDTLVKAGDEFNEYFGEVTHAFSEVVKDVDYLIKEMINASDKLVDAAASGLGKAIGRTIARS